MRGTETEVNSCIKIPIPVLRTDQAPTILALLIEQFSSRMLCDVHCRYCHLRPSRRRTTQFVADVTTILLYTSELLYYACDSLSPLLDPCHADNDIYHVHNSCSCLLAAVTVIGAPLESVYRVFRKGFNKKSANCDKDGMKGNVSQWLSWIQPQLFPHRKIW